MWNRKSWTSRPEGSFGKVSSSGGRVEEVEGFGRVDKQWGRGLSFSLEMDQGTYRSRALVINFASPPKHRSL